MTENPQAPSTETARPTNPEERARDNITGLGITCQGHEWLLPYAQLAPALDSTRDRIYHAMMTTRQVCLRDIWNIARVLLHWNYRLTPEEASAIVQGFDQAELVDAIVLTTMCTRTHYEITYSQWLRSALHAAGLDPEKIPGECLGDVIQHLINTKRITPAEDMVSFHVIDKTRREILSL